MSIFKKAFILGIAVLSISAFSSEKDSKANDFAQNTYMTVLVKNSLICQKNY